MDGMINVYKERGFTSHDVVAKLRGILKQKKIGHTGTLDPEAEGVLPVCLGKATKVCELLADKDKSYEAVMQLGVVTDTQDMAGAILEEKSPYLDFINGVDGSLEESLAMEAAANRILEACLSFQGQYSQVPPMYSALKVNGKKLYELAREGKEVERKPRNVTIHQISVGRIDLGQGQVELSVSCSKGTYIRTLCHDIGASLGCGAAMKSLKRTRAGQFLDKDSLTLARIEELAKAGQLESHLLPVDGVFSHCPKVAVKKESEKLVYNGNPFSPSHIARTEGGETPGGLLGQVRVYDFSGAFVGLYQYEKGKNCYRPVKMFL